MHCSMPITRLYCAAYTIFMDFIFAVISGSR